MNKKGAIELSMTTIIVIVLGITLLSLGLVLISNLFADAEDLIGGAFEQGETEIAEIFGSSNADVALSPSEIALEQGDTETVTLALRNSGETSVSNVYAEVEAIEFGGGAADNIRCGFDDTGTTTTDTYSLESGEKTSRGLIVKDDGADLGGPYICAVTVYNLAGGEETVSLVITVE